MQRQDEVFLHEGSEWYRRNQRVLESYTEDRIVNFVIQKNLAQKAILDLGASNGWRLRMLAPHTQAELFGIEPGEEAVKAAESLKPRAIVTRGVSHDLSQFADQSIDLVIISFVLHWVDRAQLLKTVAEVDRILANGGYIIIQDFDPGFAAKTNYHHLPEASMFTYKQAYWDIFKSSQLYHIIHQESFAHNQDLPLTPDNTCTMAVLHKNMVGFYAQAQRPQ